MNGVNEDDQMLATYVNSLKQVASWLRAVAESSGTKRVNAVSALGSRALDWLYGNTQPDGYVLLLLLTSLLCLSFANNNNMSVCLSRQICTCYVHGLLRGGGIAAALLHICLPRIEAERKWKRHDFGWI